MTLFQDPGQIIWGLILVLAILAAAADTFLMRRLTRTLPAVGEKAPRNRRLLRYLLTTVSFLLLAAGMMRPAWGRPDRTDIKTRGRDIVFLVDVSRSMLARDLVPDRLGRGRAEILKLIPNLEGDRVALVAYSGKPVIKCPLTTDYSFFRQAVTELDTDSVPLGGTDIGMAIQFVSDMVFDDKATSRKDLILITDGGDMGQTTDKTATEAGRRGIRIIIIGLGSETTGSPIPVMDESGTESRLVYQGEEVQVKMDAAVLRRIAGADPSFRFIPVNSGTIDMTTLYQALIRSAEKGDTGTITLEQYPERYPWFVLPALVLLAGELLLRFLPMKRKTGQGRVNR
jgi:Ca-activated chloride channel family protein